MNITEVFESIQGEGALMGIPMLFIRLEGCNLSCAWCDTKHAFIEGSEYSVDKVRKIISKSALSHVCWTGGEPLLQRDEIINVIKKCKGKIHCLETNGTIEIPENIFDFVSVSPKELTHAPIKGANIYKIVVDSPNESSMQEIDRFIECYNIPKSMIYLQPQCTTREDALREGMVLWDLCIKHGYAFSPRLHTLYYDNARCR